MHNVEKNKKTRDKTWTRKTPDEAEEDIKKNSKYTYIDDFIFGGFLYFYYINSSENREAIWPFCDITEARKNKILENKNGQELLARLYNMEYYPAMRPEDAVRLNILFGLMNPWEIMNFFKMFYSI